MFSICLVLLGLLVIPPCASAHPPSDVQLAFDPGSRNLSVTITHMVADPTTHYVKRVLITGGNSVISNNTYTSQPSPSTFTYSYPIPEGVAGEIQVEADCSLFGSTTRSIQVPGDSSAPTADAAPPSTVTPPKPPAVPGKNGPPSTIPATPAATSTKAGIGFLPAAAAIALVAAWRFRR